MDEYGNLQISGVRIVSPTGVLDQATLSIRQEKILGVEGYAVEAREQNVKHRTIGVDKRNGGRSLFDDWQGDWLIPGLIDTHVHGAGGADTMDGSIEALAMIAGTQLRHGTTAFLATTMTSDVKRFQKSLNAVKEFMETAVFEHGAECLGIHMEGPFISRQFSGAQKADWIQDASVAALERYQSWSGGNLRILTLAPEAPNIERVIRACGKMEVIPSAGHSGASWSEAEKGKDWGIRHVTHGFNAMHPLHHREPGLIGAALEDREVFLELIADGVHVHPSVLGMAYRLKGYERIILVSDGSRAVGMVDGEYELGGQTICVNQKEARLADGTLAGSTASLLDGVRTMLFRIGVPVHEAVQMATLVPAKLLGVDKRIGSLEPGKEATFLRLGADWLLKEIWLRGSRVMVIT